METGLPDRRVGRLCHVRLERRMKDAENQSEEGWGLLAFGKSQRWEVSIDESHRGGEWSMEIEGPQTYFSFQLRSLDVLSEALALLRSEMDSKPSPHSNMERGGDELTLGSFADAAVTLRRDNEDFPRCFIAVAPSPRAGSSLVLSLYAEDIAMLCECLQQVLAEV